MKRKTKYKISILNPLKVFWRGFEAKLPPLDYAEGSALVFDDEAFAQAADAADWSDDPGTGRAILLDDGRELLNPVPMEPPVGHDEEPSINALVERALALHFEKLSKNADAERTLGEIVRFDDDNWDEFFSPWELTERQMEPEVPDIPKSSVVAEAPVEPAVPAEPPVKPEKVPKVKPEA